MHGYDYCAWVLQRKFVRGSAAAPPSSRHALAAECLSGSAQYFTGRRADPTVPPARGPVAMPKLRQWSWSAAGQVAGWAALARACVVALSVGIAALEIPYDSSTQLDKSRPISRPVSSITTYLSPLGNWDGVYFLHAAQYGYEYELFHAFFPGLPAVMLRVEPWIQLLWPALDQRDVLVLAGALVRYVRAWQAAHQRVPRLALASPACSCPHLCYAAACAPHSTAMPARLPQPWCCTA